MARKQPTAPTLFGPAQMAQEAPTISQWEQDCIWEITFLKAIAELEDVDIEGYENRERSIQSTMDIELWELLQAALTAIYTLEHQRKHLSTLSLLKPQIMDKINFYNHLKTLIV